MNPSEPQFPTHNPKQGVLWQKDLAHGSTEERYRHYDAGDKADAKSRAETHRAESNEAMKEHNAK